MFYMFLEVENCCGSIFRYKMQRKMEAILNDHRDHGRRHALHRELLLRSLQAHLYL